MLHRRRWIVAALAFPLCAVLGGVAVLAVSFGRASSESLRAASAVGRLLEYESMSSTISIGGQVVHAQCTEATVRSRGRTKVPAALAVIGGRAFYDSGHGIRIAPTRELANGLDRARFFLAGCPRFIGLRIAARLLRAFDIETAAARRGGVADLSIRFGTRKIPMDLEVRRDNFTPVALRFLGTHLRGWSRLEPRVEIDAVRYASAFRFLRPAPID